MTTITKTEREMIDAAVAEGKVTKVKAGRARGVNKRTAPMTTTKPTKAQRGKATKTTKATTKAKATKAAGGGVMTSVEIAKEHNMSAKTLRARIRRNIDEWAPLFKDGVKHTFADNKTTRAKIDALLS